MAIRIDTNLEGSTLVIRIAGRLSSEAVVDLMKQSRSAREGCVLDLSQLRSADDEGVSAIRALLHEGALVRGDSPFIRLLLSHE